MKARVIRRGGEVAVIIPDDVAKSGLAEGDEVDVEVRGSDVVITQSKLTLDELVDRITDENRHELIDFGPPVGKEAW
jgi:antitoxin MazE